MATPSQLEQPLVEQLLEELLEGVPDRVDPGTVIVLKAPIKNAIENNPYVALFACPRCGSVGLVTHRQISCKDWMICGSDLCSAEWRLVGEKFSSRPPQ